jgi:hypothetical protein
MSGPFTATEAAAVYRNQRSSTPFAAVKAPQEQVQNVLDKEPMAAEAAWFRAWAENLLVWRRASPSREATNSGPM